MPVKTRGSHAFAALASMVVGTILSKYVRNRTPPLADAATTVGTLLTRATGTAFSRDLVGTMLVMIALSFVRGSSTT